MNAPIEDISKFLDGTLDAEKTDALVQWREASTENEKYFQEMIYVWESTSTSTKEDTEVLSIDIEQALQKVNSNIESTKVVNIKPRFNFLAIAASLVILIAAVFTFQQINTAADKIRIIASADIGQSVTLPDKSTIWLEPKSSISYLPSFSAGRHITIEGEVFVDVTRNEALPFIVKSPHMMTEVLGTSFVIRDVQDEKTSHVTVLSGKVKVIASKTNDHVILTKDMTAQYNVGPSTLNIAKSAISPNHLYAATRQLRFSETTLFELFGQLEIFSSSNIELKNNDLANCPFTGSFKTNDVGEILQKIQPIYNFNIESIAGKFIISGGSCN